MTQSGGAFGVPGTVAGTVTRTVSPETVKPV
jgi:hypothetical protein